MSDVQAAAERLRRYKSDPASRWTHGSWASDYIESLQIVARSYLAEHPADDGVAIDEEWLWCVGFGEGTINGWPFLHSNAGGDPIELWIDHEGFVSFLQSNRNDHVAFAGKQIKTRGQLRHLAAALGIGLKE